jgi:hypothetical protein
MLTRSSADGPVSSLVVCLLAATLLSPFSVYADRAEEMGLSKLGDDQLKWFGLKIYRASLWSESNASAENLYTNTVLLTIDYDLNISKQKLLQNTRKEWQRLDGQLDPKEEAWLEEVEGIFTDVTAGDSISSLFIPGKGTHFYLGQREIGYIKDNDFGPAFLAIWLDPNTREKRMRKNLLRGLIQRN